MRQMLKVASAVSLALWLSACGKEEAPSAAQQAQPPMEVGVVEVQASSQNIKVELPGRSRAFLEAEVRPQVSGIIMERNFVEGREVKEGQSLYKIDDATYKAALESAKADLASAQASLASAKARAARYEKLVKTNAISKQDYDEADAAYKEAQARVKVAEAQLHTAGINLKYTQVQAPISGRIGKSAVTPGALVTANQGQVLATIQQLNPINVDITQSSAQLLALKAKLRAGKLQAADNAEVQLVLEDGTTYEHKGKLQFAEVSVDENTGSVILRAEFPNPDNVLLPGMYVRAVLNTGVDPNAILVPQKAITRNTRGEAVAMVVNAESQVEARNVTTAEVIDHQWRVTSGLKAGDKLIIEGLQKIRPGAPVVAKPAGQEQAQ
ncbi:efflux RND transporter periplasmic adaptor subunit [Shewanella sp. JM162201]|uniref:Efflux RND transporter periplasmic adaptor subunit n=1 Tax=Shewanella jiangmenensis TaxID=2837387 RepID=A0ABS5V3V0_9GAMM|nr:efflux RND transporter periplasmic adaptor subunit [Shewanella jiangmenensis]MBT1445131.1 efflux RND transporter periplasmic adaptor subunit [Shewanella jiangmenensis]